MNYFKESFYEPLQGMIPSPTVIVSLVLAQVITVISEVNIVLCFHVSVNSSTNGNIIKLCVYTEVFQWLEPGWLVYHGCFKLVLESLGKILIAAN